MYIICEVRYDYKRIKIDFKGKNEFTLWVVEINLLKRVFI